MTKMKKFLIALQFLTVLPINVKGKIEEKDFGESLVYFPMIGLLMGIFLAFISFSLGPLPPLVRSALILIIWIIMTGGIHLDGFADTCDGFYGKRAKEDILKIMRDSHIGTMGAGGIAVLLLLKFSIVSSIQPENLWKVLIIAVAFARWSQALACATSEYARDEGKAKYFMAHARKSGVLTGAVFTLILFWLLMDIKGAILFLLLSATILLFIKYVKGKIGGMTGDTIGATNEIAEAAALLFSLISLNCKI